MKGEKEAAPKKSTTEKILEAPLSFINTGAEMLFGGVAKVDKKEEKAAKILTMTMGERGRMEAVERKASKIQYKCKIRFIYVGKKENFSKGKIVQSFVGALKQFNTNDLQALKPDGNVGVNGTLVFFKEQRNNRRKNSLISAYQGRSGGIGLQPFYLGIDELASLWHLPAFKDVKAPQLKKTEAKKVEPPMNLPFAP